MSPAKALLQQCRRVLSAYGPESITPALRNARGELIAEIDAALAPEGEAPVAWRVKDKPLDDPENHWEYFESSSKPSGHWDWMEPLFLASPQPSGFAAGWAQCKEAAIGAVDSTGCYTDAYVLRKAIKETLIALQPGSQ